MTEGKKNDRIDGKVRMDLLPWPELEEIARVYTAGAKKYGARNWMNLEDGYERYKGALLRHLCEVEKGNVIDSDTGCYHIAQVAINAMFMLHFKLKEYATETWKDIEVNSNYQVSSLGNIRNKNNGNILKQQDNGNGYKLVCIRINKKLKRLYVHRIVAYAFCPKKTGKDYVDHINGIRDDNRFINLRWCTQKENSNYELARINASSSLKIAMNRPETKKKLRTSMEKVYNDPNVRKKLSDAAKLNRAKGVYKDQEKKVAMLYPDGKIEKEYQSLSSVKEDGFDPSFVCKVCNNKKRYAYGRRWTYVK